MKSLNIKISDQAYKTLKHLANKKNLSEVEILRRSLAVYAYIENEKEQNNLQEVTLFYPNIEKNLTPFFEQ